jgi:hypothetical protein
MKRFLLACAVLLLGTTAAHGDGGTMLLHQDSGPFTVTVFAAPQPLHVGMADISVMVQDRTNGEVLLDPVIDVALNQEAPVRLLRAQTGNRLLQAAQVRFPRAGQWTLGITVQRGRDVARFRTTCSVEADHSRVVLLWFYLLLPVAVIVLFAVHQVLQARQSR